MGSPSTHHTVFSFRKHQVNNGFLPGLSLGINLCISSQPLPLILFCSRDGQVAFPGPVATIISALPAIPRAITRLNFGAPCLCLRIVKHLGIAACQQHSRTTAASEDQAKTS